MGRVAGVIAFLIHHLVYYNPLQSFAVASGAVSKPGGDAAGQDALHSAGVECSEDAGAHSKLPQLSQEEEALMCLLQHCICVSGLTVRVM